MQDIETFDIPLEFPAGYPYHINQVINFSNRGIFVLKRNLSLTIPYKFKTYDISQCEKIIYRNSISYLKVAGGVTLLSLLAAIFYYMCVYWNELPPDTTIKIGLLALAIGYGIRWVLGAKSHKLIFCLKNNKKIKWVSGSGDYQYRTAAVSKLLKCAKNINIEVINEVKAV